ncbi:MAG TPA: hypothetical protein VFC46_02505 [Humisphaera sp.]|nr:hypothetical protein [Humisphaera sp.]
MKAMIIITQQHIRELYTDRGGITGAVVDAIAETFGVDTKISGWPRLLIGKRIDEESWERIKAKRLEYTPKGAKLAGRPKVENVRAEISDIEFMIRYCGISYEDAHKTPALVAKLLVSVWPRQDTAKDKRIGTSTSSE